MNNLKWVKYGESNLYKEFTIHKFSYIQKRLVVQKGYLRLL